MKVKLDNIIEAIEMQDEFSECLLDKETGKIEWVSDMAQTFEEQEEIYDRLDEHGFYRLPTQRDLNEYDTMEDFVYTRTGREQDMLSVAIEGRGAFRRFKDTVNRLGIDDEWYNYRDEANKRKAIEWCEENNLEYE